MKFLGLLVVKYLSAGAALVWAFIWLSQCQISDSRRAAGDHHPVAHTGNTQNKPPDRSVGVISGDKTGILVSAQWMQKYKTLEAKFGTIPQDGMIYMEGEQYRIPSAVADHFSTMVRSEAGS